MRFIVRYLSPLLRSRRRSPFSIVLSLLFLLLCILFLINYNKKSNEYLSSHHEEVLPIKNNNRLLPTLITTSTASTHKKGLWPLDEKGRSLKKKFLVLDLTGFFGSGASEGAETYCASSNTSFIWTRDQNRIDELDFVISHDAGGNFPLEYLHLDSERQQYSMAFIMESEAHSSTGEPWKKFNFKMSYNLDDSYPEPATYFDINLHIIDLLRPPAVSFENKEKQADIVWIISNCNAYNGRETFIQQLMQEIKIDSYGSCLNNRQGYAARMTDNIDAYRKYKFVIAIENSNCYDYVTEKLVKAVESGSIPIVAGMDGRPDYRRYMPQHSYINVYDYKSVKALADDLKRIANNQTLYESYLWYKKHDKNVTQIARLPLSEKLKHFADVIGANATIITEGIVGKEKSENKVCKLVRFVRQTPWKDIAAHNRTARPGTSIACLPARNLQNDFTSQHSNSNQTK